MYLDLHYKFQSKFSISKYQSLICCTNTALSFMHTRARLQTRYFILHSENETLNFNSKYIHKRYQSPHSPSFFNNLQCIATYMYMYTEYLITVLHSFTVRNWNLPFNLMVYPKHCWSMFQQFITIYIKSYDTAM